MNYEIIYNNLINTTKNRTIKNNEYYEKHHIIPKCMNGSNEENNLVKLTAREHYIAHGLLVKIYKNTHHLSKLICAFRYMSVDSHGNKRTGKDYAWMRKLYSEYHPMKNPIIAKKLQED